MMTTDQAWELIKGDKMPMDNAIRTIQLDAMKEGMRRAAENVKSAGYVGCDWRTYSDAILAAAEQLTEKDLCQ